MTWRDALLGCDSIVKINPDYSVPMYLFTNVGLKWMSVVVFEALIKKKIILH